ncbi:MAG: hypothetical protein K0R54_135 [Clostridiaceae bacterium]|jgi:hypothetical protein|nr:hypothetical protein [Clostridiaceae bacterium]
MKIIKRIKTNRKKATSIIALILVTLMIGTTVISSISFLI